MFQDEEEAAAEIPASIRGVLRQLEKIRFGYAFNKEFEFSSGVNYANNIKLYSGNSLSYAAVIGKEYQSNINPKRDYNDPINIQKSRDTKKFLYYEFREPNATQNAVEIKVPPSEKTYLENYVFIDQNKWKTQTSTLIENENRDFVLERFVCYPEIAYNEFSVQQRIDLLKKLASGSMTEIGVVNEERLAIQIIKTTPNSQVAELFTKLEEGSLFKDLTSKIHNVFGTDNYTSFIFELLVKFYSQSEEDVKNRVINGKVLTWHKHETYTEGDPLTQVRTRIDYSTGFIANGQVCFEGTINQVRPPSQQVYTKQLPREEMSAFSVIGVHFSSSPGFLNIPEGEVMPIPAFFFKWINDEHVSRVVKEGTSLAITVASFTFGVGELVTAKNTLRVATAIIGLAKQTGDICFNTPSIKSKLTTILGNQNVIIQHWNKISVVLAMVSIDIKLLDEAPVLFDAFAEAWGQAKQDDAVWQNIKQDLSEQEITSIENFVEIVNEN